MGKGKSEPAQYPGVEQSHILAAYQAAVTLWAYEGNLIWSKYNAMLVGNSIFLLAAIGLLTGSSPAPAAGRGLLVMGLILCAIWGLITERGFEAGYYWIESAKEIERHLGGPVNLAGRGGKFAEGNAVDFASGKSMRMSRRARFLRARHGALLVIALFAFVYLGLLLFTFFPIGWPPLGTPTAPVTAP